MKISILSYHGSAHLLALELVGRGYEVCVLDVSACLGLKFPSEHQGPFGYFHSDALSEIQRNYLEIKGYKEQVEEGFILWDEKAPLVLQKPLSQFHFDSKKDLELFHTKPQKTESFRSSWRYHLCSNLFSCVYDNQETSPEASSFEFTKDYFFLRLRKDFLERTHEYLEKHGIEIKKISPHSFCFKKNVLKYIQLDKGRCHSDYWILSLTGEMLEKIHPSLKESLYPKGCPQSYLSWFRMNMEVEKNEAFDILPIQSVWILKPSQPWTHDNLLWCQKNPQNRCSLWLRLPTHLISENSYLEKVFLEVKSHMLKKIPFLSLKKVQKSEESLYDQKGLFFPLYEKQELVRKRAKKIKNVFFANLETKRFYNWEFQKEALNETVLEIEQKVKRIRK